MLKLSKCVKLLMAMLILWGLMLSGGCSKHHEEDSPPVITGVEVSGPTSVSEGNDVQLSASADYDDGQKKNITDAVDWKIDNSCASISKDGKLSTGNVEVDTIVTVTATCKSGDSTLTGQLKVTVLALNDDSPVSLTILGPATVPRGSSGNFSAFLTLADGTIKDVTHEVYWSVQYSYGNNCGTIDEEGNFIADNVRGGRSATIRATYNRNGAEKITTFLITISDLPDSSPTLVGLQINVPSSIFGGNTVSCTANANFSDGSIKDVTKSSGWGTDNIGAASINNYGTLTSYTVTSDMTVKVSATFIYLGISKTATANVVIKKTPPKPISLTITGAPSVDELTATNYTFWLNNDDGSKKDVTNLATATVNIPDYSSISKGVLTALDVPYNLLCTISASYSENDATFPAVFQVTIVNKVVVAKYKAPCSNFDAENPYGANITDKQIRDRLGKLAPYFVAVKTSLCNKGFSDFAKIALEFQLKVRFEIPLTNDDTANQTKIASAIAAATAYNNVEIIVLGTNVLSEGILAEGQLLGYIDQIKAADADMPVTVDEIYTEWPSLPNVVAACDTIYTNMDLFEEGRYIDIAVAYLDFGYHDVVKVAAGKPVVISSIGWPSSGDQIGDAIASPENAALHFLNVVSWARTRGADFCYGETENNYGVLDQNGGLKTGMEKIFNNETMADNWSYRLIPGGDGMLSVEITSFTDNLYGIVWHVRPQDYYLVVFINRPVAK